MHFSILCISYRCVITYEKQEEASLHIVYVDFVVVSFLTYSRSLPAFIPNRHPFGRPFLYQTDLMHFLQPKTLKGLEKNKKQRKP